MGAPTTEDSPSQHYVVNPQRDDLVPISAAADVGISLAPLSIRDVETDISIAATAIRQVQYTLSWSNLTFSVCAKKRKSSTSPARLTRKRVILKNVSGRCGAGELTAVMGPSGCGKTTLMDILADRVCSGQLEGRIELNGVSRETRAFRAIARYVAQEDTLLGSFTVLETLQMAAKLSLPSKVTDAMVQDRVQSVLDEIGLRNCMHTRVGDIFTKGISGGQKRRLSMAIELLSDPPILLLDEPTSGLDSASMFNIMKLVQKLCQEHGKTIICTIHQPSSLVCGMFTNIVILSAGETVYCGPRVDMIAHFASAGYNCPAYSNPMDYFIEVVNADFDDH